MLLRDVNVKKCVFFIKFISGGLFETYMDKKSFEVRIVTNMEIFLTQPPLFTALCAKQEHG